MLVGVSKGRSLPLLHLQGQCCIVAELEDVLAEAQRVSPQVDAYLADSTHSKGKGKKPVSRSNDLEAQ